MNVGQVMSRDVRACHSDDALSRAAQMMWEADSGCIPVVDQNGKPTAMLTDRDVCMAAYTRGQRLDDVRVSDVASRRLILVHQEDPIANAEQLMREYQIRRLPVVDASGRLVGILSLNDLVRRNPAGKLVAASADGVVKTLSAICQTPVSATKS